MSNANATHAADGGDGQDGWMLLHRQPHPDRSELQFSSLFDRLDLSPTERQTLTFGGVVCAWRAGDDARALVAKAASAPAMTFGLDAPPLVHAGDLLAFRVASPGARSTPIEVQRLCSLAGLVASAIEAETLCWLPTPLWSRVEPFSQAVIATERQGLPPIMHLVGFEIDSVGVVHTRGLAWFSGHELRLTAPSGYPAREALRRTARLAIDALHHCGLVGPMDVAGIDKGEVLVIGPRVDEEGRTYVHVELRPA